MAYEIKNSNYNNDLSSWQINDNCHSRNMFFNCPIESKYKPFKDDERKTCRLC